MEQIFSLFSILRKIFLIDMKNLSLIILICLVASGQSQECAQRKYDSDSNVCVCNSTYCDFLVHKSPDNGKFISYASSKSGDRLKPEEGTFHPTSSNDIKLQLDLTKTYQEINGFGGAFTDAAGINIKSLSKATQTHLMRSLFAPEGSRYNIGRTPIGGADFSDRGYTLDDVEGDVTLTNFSLTHDDHNYKIPFMKWARQLNSELKIMAVAWTAPIWMKTNHAYTGPNGVLKEEYYKLFADYLIKFLEHYKKEGVPIWALGPTNEVDNVFRFGEFIVDMGWKPQAMANWMVNDFWPALQASQSKETIIVQFNEQRSLLPGWIDEFHAANKEVEKMYAGIAHHWYHDKTSPASNLDETHKKYPDKFLIMGEASCERGDKTKSVINLGSWSGAEDYIHDIIENSNHWSTGWIDWNFALNTAGGPNWQGNFVESTIIVNSEQDEFYKQPTFHALAHFSKFVPRGSRRVHLSHHDIVESVAFLTPDNEIVVVLFNPTDDDLATSVVDANQGNINVNLEKHSFRTIVYKK